MENYIIILIALISIIILIFTAHFIFSLKNSRRISDSLNGLSAIFENFTKNHNEFDKSVISNIKELNSLVIEVKKLHTDSLIKLNTTLSNSLNVFSDKVNLYFENNNTQNNEFNKILSEMNSSLMNILSDYNKNVLVHMENNKMHNDKLIKSLDDGLNKIDSTLKETINVES